MGHGSHSAVAGMFLYSTLLYFRLFCNVNGAWQPFSRGDHGPIFHASIFTTHKWSCGKLCFYGCLWFCSQGGGWYPSMHCRSRGPHPGGKLRHLAWGVSRPTPRGSPGPHLGASPGTHLGVSRHTPGGSPGTDLGGIAACTEADTPPSQQMATAAGSTYPTGMLSCLGCFVRRWMGHGSHSAVASMFLYSTLLYFRLFCKEVGGAWQPFSRSEHVPIFHTPIFQVVL